MEPRQLYIKKKKSKKLKQGRRLRTLPLRTTEVGLKDYNFLNTFTASKSPGDFEKNADSHSARWSWWLRLFELPREAEAPGPRTTFGETRFLSVIRRLIFTDW